MSWNWFAGWEQKRERRQAQRPRTALLELESLERREVPNAAGGLPGASSLLGNPNAGSDPSATSAALCSSSSTTTGTGSTGGSTGSTGSALGSVVGGSTSGTGTGGTVAASALTIAQALQSGNASQALQALQGFVTYLSTQPTASQPQLAMQLLTDVIADLS